MYTFTPKWFFRAVEHPSTTPNTFPCPSPLQVYNALQLLGMLAGLAPTVLDTEAPGTSRTAVGLPWIPQLPHSVLPTSSHDSAS